MAKSFTIQGLSETDLMDILTCVGLTSRLSDSAGYPAATIRRLDTIGSKLLTIAEEHGLDTRVKGNFEHLPAVEDAAAAQQDVQDATIQ